MTDALPLAPPPDDLADDALALWTSYVAEHTYEEGDELVEPDGRELALLLRACRAVENAERLSGAVSALPTLTVQGSTGQTVAHPLLATLAAAEKTAQDALRALATPTDVTAVASAKAHARWNGSRR